MTNDLKEDVKAHWQREVCGSRYGKKEHETKIDLEAMASERYRLEPYIADFADFNAAKGKEILEIGVGGGVDFSLWAKYGARVTGIDLTNSAIQLTRKRLIELGFPDDVYRLAQGDAENLPFEDTSFDIVYSWGVLHHTPDTRKAFQEAYRVLRSGGQLRAMVYHVPSITAWLLWIRYCFLTGRWLETPKSAVYRHLESRGTKAYTVAEMRSMLQELGYESINVYPKLAFGDLLQNKRSKKYQSPIYSLIWKLYPRWLIRMLGDKYGVYLFIQARR